MTPEAKAKLSKTIRALRERLLLDLEDALRGTYNLGIAPAQAKLPDARAKRRERLDAWVDEQVRALPEKERKTARQMDAAIARFRGEVVKQAAYTWLNRLVYLRLLEGMKLRSKLITGGVTSRLYGDFRELAQALVGHDDGDDSDGYLFLLGLVFDELALDLPGLFERRGLGELVPMRWSTLRLVIETLDDPELSSCWNDDMTLGWVYQYWNDPEREALDAKLNAGGKVAPDEIASKTQMFTERYMVDWLLQNSLGPLWLAMCQKHGWTATVVADGTLARLEQRRIDWRGRRDAGEVALAELMPLDGEAEQRWAYYVEQPIPADAPELAPASVREIKLIDPAVGSGHFLVVAFDLLVALYREEAEHRGEVGRPEWSDQAIVESILANNLHGIDLDPRAVQIAAAALMLKAQRVCAQARPGRLNLVASKLRLGSLPDDDPALVELREQLERDTGIPGHVTDTLVRKLAGADHLGSLLKIGDALDEVLNADGLLLMQAKAEQGSLFGGGFSQELRREAVSLGEAKASLQRGLESFLAKHTSSSDLGLRLRGQQLAAGVRFVRMLEEGTYHLAVGNPPYQGTSKMEEAAYVQRSYPQGKADLYAAFLLRGIGLVQAGGTSAFLTMRNWMFIKQYSELRSWLLTNCDLRAIHDLSSGAFEEISAAQVVVSVVSSIFRKAVKTDDTAIALASFDNATLTTLGETARKRAATLCQSGRSEFSPKALEAVPDWPIIHWWQERELALYRSGPQLGDRFPVREGMGTRNDARFLREWWEVDSKRVWRTRARFCPPVGEVAWVPFLKGGGSRRWIEPLNTIVEWRGRGMAIANFEQSRFGRGADFYFQQGVAVSVIGSNFGARLHRFASVIGDNGTSVFPSAPRTITALLCSTAARKIVESLNPSITFKVNDVNRIPLFEISDDDEIIATLESAFTTHEAHREPSVEFRHPGPGSWRHAQAWAQLAVDRPENTPLPAYEEILDPEPPTDHISFALGVALGRFSPNDEGILDPTSTASLAHALPHGTLFLDGTEPADSLTDSLGHPASAPLHTAWSTHSPRIDTKRKHLRDYLRLEFFDIHRSMYENRPIHWPLSSAKKTFVAWINIHRWHAGTLRHLLAQHLHPTKLRLDGALADLRKTQAGADKKAARAAEKRIEQVAAWRDELAEFLTNVSACAEQGPPPPDPKTPARTDDATYEPDLDDGVMINSAALWPLLTPQWKDPKKWWKELACAEGRKDYDWSHLAARYFKDRVDQKCKTDPSLAVAHRCFWAYHPERAHAWELRLQDEIAPDFTIDEPESDAARERFLDEHSQAAEATRHKELARRTRKLEKADAQTQEELAESDESDT
jgi:hypothetical protein